MSRKADRKRYILHAARMEDCLVNLSVYIPAMIAPINAPNSKMAAV
jgi:hypothetical protein